MPSLEDGIYDVIVVEAEERADGSIAIEVAISSGSHRGEVVALNAAGLRASWFDLLATPGTLIVEAGEPRLDL